MPGSGTLTPAHRSRANSSSKLTSGNHAKVISVFCMKAGVIKTDNYILQPEDNDMSHLVDTFCKLLSINATNKSADYGIYDLNGKRMHKVDEIFKHSANSFVVSTNKVDNETVVDPDNIDPLMNLSDDLYQAPKSSTASQPGPKTKLSTGTATLANWVTGQSKLVEKKSVHDSPKNLASIAKKQRRMSASKLTSRAKETTKGKLSGLAKPKLESDDKESVEGAAAAKVASNKAKKGVSTLSKVKSNLPTKFSKKKGKSVEQSDKAKDNAVEESKGGTVAENNCAVARPQSAATPARPSSLATGTRDPSSSRPPTSASKTKQNDDPDSHEAANEENEKEKATGETAMQDNASSDNKDNRSSQKKDIELSFFDKMGQGNPPPRFYANRNQQNHNNDNIIFGDTTAFEKKAEEGEKIIRRQSLELVRRGRTRPSSAITSWMVPLN